MGSLPMGFTPRGAMPHPRWRRCGWGKRACGGAQSQARATYTSTWKVAPSKPLLLWWTWHVQEHEPSQRTDPPQLPQAWPRAGARLPVAFRRRHGALSTARRARRRVAPIRISAARRARKSGSGQALMTHSDPSRDASGVALVTLAAACSCPSLVGRFEPRAPHTQLHGSMGLALARPRPASSGPRQPRSRAELSRASAPGPAQPPVRSLARRARRPATGRHPRALARACAKIPSSMRCDSRRSVRSASQNVTTAPSATRAPTLLNR